MGKERTVRTMLFSLLLLTIVSLSFVSSLESFEISSSKFYEKIYNKDLEKISLKEEGTDYAYYKLKSNTDQCLTNCKATGLAYLYKEGVLFSDISFKKSGVSSYEIYLVKNKTLMKSDPVEELVCVPGNVSKTQICHWEIVNSTENYYNVTDLVPYNFTVLPAGLYDWELRAIRPLDSRMTDWVFSVGKTELSEWAWWNNSWAKCKNIVFTESNGTTRTNELSNINITGLTMSSLDEIRIVNDACSAGGSEVGHYVVNGSASAGWIDVAFLGNYTASTTTNYSVYYDNTGVSASSEDSNIDYFTSFEYGDGLQGWSTSNNPSQNTTEYFGTKSMYLESTDALTLSYSDPGAPYNISVWYRWTKELGSSNTLWVLRTQDSGSAEWVGLGVNDNTADRWAALYNGGWEYYHNVVKNTWKEVILKVNNTDKPEFYLNDTALDSYTIITPRTAEKLLMSATGTGAFLVDHVTIAKYYNMYEAPSSVSFGTQELADSTNPAVVINAPSGSYSSKTITVNATATDASNIGFCYTNITTSGGGLDVAAENMTKDGSTDYFNVTVNVSAYADYYAHVFCHDTVGNINWTNSSFSVVFTAGGGATSGGGGSNIELPEDFWDIWDWLRVLRAGGSFDEITYTWNPGLQPEMKEAWKNVFASESAGSLFGRIGNFFGVFFKYLFRQPASLTPGGGL